MVQSRFKFADLGDFSKISLLFLLLVITVLTNIVIYFILDGLVRQCLNTVPQYSQVYPAPKSDVSTSLEEMITKGFPPNQNIVWHRATHSQKRYYWVMKQNGDDEVRVKVSGGDICSKAGECQRFNPSLNNASI
jgi:hypothetical protein